MGAIGVATMASQPCSIEMGWRARGLLSMGLAHSGQAPKRACAATASA